MVHDEVESSLSETIASLSFEYDMSLCTPFLVAMRTSKLPARGILDGGSPLPCEHIIQLVYRVHCVEKRHLAQ